MWGKSIRSLPVVICSLTYLLISTSQPVYAEQSAPDHPMQVCGTTSDTNCIESIFATLPDGRKIQAKHLNDQGSAENLLNIWQIPGAKFENGEDQFASRVNWRKDGEALCWADSQVCSHHSGSIDLIFWPYGPGIILSPIHFPYDETDLQCGTPANRSLCGMWLNFGQNIEWDVIFRIQGFKLGMLSGRSKNAKLSDLDVNLPTSESHRIELIGTNYMQDSNIVNSVRNTPAGSRQYADTKSDGYIAWIWDSNNDALTRFPTTCMANNISGPVSHFMFNTYNIGSPTWDNSSKTLAVSVESPHFSADGALASGYYEMFFPAKVAKCLWGISDSSSAKANVSVLNENGQVDIATITQKNDSNGLTIIAANFHFSRPTIKVKFDVPPQTPNLESKVELTKAPALKVCVKGKLIKRLTSPSAACPKGFKAKTS